MKCEWCGEDLVVYEKCVAIPCANFRYICWGCIEENTRDPEKEEEDYKDCEMRKRWD